MVLVRDGGLGRHSAAQVDAHLFSGGAQVSEGLAPVISDAEIPAGLRAMIALYTSPGFESANAVARRAGCHADAITRLKEWGYARMDPDTKGWHLTCKGRSLLLVGKGQVEKSCIRCGGLMMVDRFGYRSRQTHCPGCQT